MTLRDGSATAWDHREPRYTVLQAYRALLFPRPKRPWWTRLCWWR